MTVRLITNCACIWFDNRLQNLITISYCGYTTSRKHIQSVRPSNDIPDGGPNHHWASAVPVNFDNVTVCITFSLASPHPSTSIVSWHSEPALICEEYSPPVTKLPVMMLTSKVQSLYTVLRSENWASGRLSGSHNIIMESVPISLVGQVNISSPAKVNFQGSSCTHSIPTRQQDEKTVLHRGCHSGATLALSPGVLAGFLVTSP